MITKNKSKLQNFVFFNLFQKYFFLLTCLMLLGFSNSVSAAQFNGYVCEVRLIHASPHGYGDHGTLKVKFTRRPECRGGDPVGVATYILTTNGGAGSNSQFHVTEAEIIALHQSYQYALANNLYVRFNATNFGGGLQIFDATFVRE